MSAKMFYLQNLTAGYCGNSPLWWEASDSGYTTRLDCAKKFTAQEVAEIIRSTRGSHRWKKWSVKTVDSAAHRSVDIQDLRGHANWARSL